MALQENNPHSKILDSKDTEDENDVAAALAMVQSPAGAAVAANVLVAVQEAGNDDGQAKGKSAVNRCT